MGLISLFAKAAPLLSRAGRSATRIIAGSRAARLISRPPVPIFGRGFVSRAKGFVSRGRGSVGRFFGRFRKPKGIITAKPSLGRRALSFGAKTALGAGAFIAAEAGIRRLVGRRGASQAARGVQRGVTGAVTGTGVLQPTAAAGGVGVGLLSKVGKFGAAAALGGAALFGAEQLAEKFGVRGGAGFIGRRPETAAQAAAMGLRRRSRKKQLLITRPEMRAVRSLKGKVKRISKALSLIGMKVVRTGSKSSGFSPGVITRPEARRAFKK